MLKVIGWIVALLFGVGTAQAQQTVTLPAYGNTVLTLKPQDFKKNLVRVDGIPVLVPSKSGVVQVSACAVSGLVYLCPVKWLAGPDTVTLAATADSKIGEGVKSVTNSKAYTITTEAPEATDIEIETGPIEIAAVRVPFTVAIASHDEESGVASVALNIDGRSYFTQAADITPSVVEVVVDTLTAGEHRLEGIARDNAGNEARAELSVMVAAQ